MKYFIYIVHDAKIQKFLYRMRYKKFFSKKNAAKVEVTFAAVLPYYFYHLYTASRLFKNGRKNAKSFARKECFRISRL